MPLSAPIARLVLAAFLAVGAGVATNLLVWQAPESERPAARSERPINRLDVEHMRRLSREVAAGDEPAPDPAGRAVIARGEAGMVVQRLGSFAPSSSRLALAEIPAADPAEARRAMVRGVQIELARRGYAPGPADGSPGLGTRAAVMAYEHDHGLPLSADPSPALLAHLRQDTAVTHATADARPRIRPGGHAEAVVRAVQASLRQLGYLSSAPDGVMADETVRAIRDFEMDSGLVPSGRISAQLVAQLARAPRSP